MGALREELKLGRKQESAKEKPVNQGRHEYQCSICKHSSRVQIEQEFIAWASPTRIAKTYGISRDSLYRHVHALNLLVKRGRNARVALERLIEKVDHVKPNAAAIVAAVSAYARINARGEWVEKRETVDLNGLFERMSTAELEQYARTGELPAWFPVSADATTNDGQGGNDE